MWLLKKNKWTVSKSFKEAAYLSDIFQEIVSFKYLGRKAVFDFWGQVGHNRPDFHVYSPYPFHPICILKSQFFRKSIFKRYIKSFSWQACTGSALLDDFPENNNNNETSLAVFAVNINNRSKAFWLLFILS